MKELEILLSTLEEKILNSKISKTTRAGVTEHFQKFTKICQDNNINLYEDESKSFTEMVYNLKYPDKTGICHCGNKCNFVDYTKGYRHTCSIQCRSNNPEYVKNLAAAKTAQYNDPVQKAAIEAKKIATNMEKLGVAHPMQNISSFEKQNQACFKGHVKHAGIIMQGYEPKCYDFLTQMYDVSKIHRGTDYLKANKIVINWYDDNNKKHISYPDFFVEELNSFFEVKSSYTMQTGQYKITKCQERLNEMGYGYIICVYAPKKAEGVMLGMNLELFNTEHIIDPDDGCSLDFMHPYFDTVEEMIQAVDH